MDMLKNIISPSKTSAIKRLILKVHGLLILVVSLLFITLSGYKDYEVLNMVSAILYFYVALVGGNIVLCGNILVMVISQSLMNSLYDDRSYYLFMIVINSAIIALGVYINLKFKKIIKEEKERKKIFLNVIDDMPYLILLYDEDRVQFINKRFLKRVKMESIPWEEVKEIHLSNYMNADEYLKLVGLLNDFEYKDTTPEGVFNIKFSEQSRRYRVILSKLLYKSKDVIMQFLIDVTKESLAKEKLNIAETEYKKMVDNLPDSIILHKNSKIIFVNKATLEMFSARTTSEMIGKSIVDFVEEPYIESTNKRFKTLKLSGELTSRELNMITLKGDVLNVEANTNIFTYDTSYAVTVIRDITKEKQVEKDRENLSLKNIYDQWKSELFANIAHELKTPVGVIYSLLQLLDMDSKDLGLGDGEKDFKAGIESIRKNCRRQLRLIENFIDVTLIESNNLTIKKELGNIVEAIEDLVSLVSKYAKDKKNIEVIFDTEVEEVFLEFDFNKIQRILLNIFSNSIKFCDEGSIIGVLICKDNNYLDINITDSGIGIPENKIGYVFDRFRQVDKSFTRLTEGSGLGLFIAKGLVEAMKGTITIDSKKDQGTSVKIRFPIYDGENEKLLDGYYNNQYKNNYIDSETMNKIETEFSDIY